ncbi:Disease resistance RPP13-like protein 4 [Hordeum vulgare]|nr:Disease resistance RPP13-like protein 4 [Hordeum vulgare]
MAELASGAVGTLLGVISHEALRLGRVRHDVQFIQEEMESMGSFLANLSGNSREHDEQVRTWMNQVRILANDCNNCIDLYLYRGDPALHLPKEGPGRYLLWAPWLLRKLLAQHRAAGQLRELKDRAQDIGNRRLRYGVEVKPVESSPSSQAGQLAEPSLLPATQDHEEEEEDDHHQDGGDPPLKVVALSMTSMKMNKEDYFRRRLDHWMVQSGVKLEAAGSEPPLPSITFVVIENKDADALPNEALDVAKAYFKRAEDEKNNGVPRDTDPAQEDKAVTPEIKDADALTHEDKAAVPSASKDVNTLCSKIRKIRWLCHRRSRTSVPLKIKDVDTLAHEDKAVVTLETKGDDDALAHEDKADVPAKIKGEGGALAHEDKPNVPSESKGDNGSLVHEDKADVTASTKGDSGAPAHEDKAGMPSSTKGDGGALAHEDKVDVPSETKGGDDGPLVHEDKVDVPSGTMGNSGALGHEDMADVPSGPKGDGGPLADEDKADLPSKTSGDGGLLAPEAKGDVQPVTKGDRGALAPEAKADVSSETKDGEHVVLVDVLEVHYSFVRLRPHKILCYILAEIKRQQKIGPPAGPRSCMLKWDTYDYRKETMGEIKTKIKTMDVNKKLQDIKICNLEDGKEQLSELQKSHKGRKNTEGKSLMGEETLEHLIRDKSLDKLLWLLIYHSTTTATSEKEKKSKSMVAELYDDIIKNTATKLGNILEKQEYENILREVFPNPKWTTTASNSTPRTLVDDIIKDMVKKEVKEMLHELRVDKSDKNPETGSEEAQTAPKDDFQVNTDNKKEEIVREIMKQLKIKMVAQKIKECLRDNNQRILVILKVSDKYVPQWEETRNSLSLLGSNCPISGAVIVAKTTQDDTRQYFGCPGLELIEYSPVGLYFDIVLQVTSQYINDHRVLHDILCKCKPHEFCMKIFAHALYAKPKRSSDELKKLHDTLRDVATQKSLPSMMFKFSYRDLPKEYRSCLLYLAIFPQGQTVRRSTLIGRWVAEGMITTKEWSWPSSVVEAEKCFDTLVARCLVCPADIGASGKVKSCMVDKLVYGFITKIAIKQRILETRLSHHLAHHFSIFSDVRLRSSEKIENFLKKSSQFSKLKVLDLEGCVCFPEYQHYLTDICRKILMLKYLSLRGTGVTRLPSEINNLLELEVLDIRETEIPASATRNVLLRKLKRLLAGKKLKDLMASQSSPADKTEKVEVLCNAKLQNVRKRLSPSHVDSSPADYFSVQIPGKIEKMLGVEVLSNVKPKNRQDLVDIATLNDLKKLGVVINKESDLQPLLNSISDLLNQSLRFLTITLDIAIYEKPEAERSLRNKPKDLESLTINGKSKCPRDFESPKDLESTSTQMWKLLESLTENGKQLAKVTLSCTFLSQKHLKVLANLKNLRCVKLRHSAYNDSKLTFNKGEFKNLNKFLVEGNNMTEIKFDKGAASNLEKIVLSSTNIVSISGVNCLQKLEELELKGVNDKKMVHSLFDNAKHIAKVTLRDTMLEQGDLKILAGNKKMRYLALLGKFYNDRHLIFEDEFQNLNLLTVDSSESDITEISFTNSSPNLEKIVWSSKEIVSLSGINKLPALKELELNGGDSVPNMLEEETKKRKIRLDYKPTDKPKKKEENKREADKSLWKVKDWCWSN